MKFLKNLKKEWKNIIFNTIFVVLTLLIVIFLYQKIILATILLLIVAISGLIKWKSKLTLAIFILGAIFGTIAEMVAINFYVWSYSFTNFINVPLWLFIVWGNAAASLYQSAVEIRKLGIKK